MRSTTLAYLGTCLFMALGLITNQAKAEDIIQLSAAGSLQRGLFKQIEGPFQKETGMKIKFNPSGTTTSINAYVQDLLAGRAEAAIASISYEDWVALMKSDQEKVEIPPDKQLTQRVVSMDLFEIFAHNDVTVKNLSQAQIQDLFSGKIKNWKELGGNDSPVTVVLAEDRMANRKAFTKIVMAGRDFAANVKLVSNAATQREYVDKTPGTVAFDSQVEAGPNTVKLKVPPLGKPVTMLTIGRPNAKVERLIKFMRERGK